jgi:2-polyprenyl-6-hydroxyphenyl methylase/3-demethylubiquinone-9 3-methyltransferase
MNIIRTLIKANIAASRAITPAKAWGAEAHRVYNVWGEGLLREKPPVVLDVGAGRRWHFAPEFKHAGMRLIGVDIDGDELVDNELLDSKITADVCLTLQVPDNSIDFVMARAAVEHFHDTEAFLRNVQAALKPNGRLIVTFPNKNAPFALINRAIPASWARWLLKTFIPGSEGRLGFTAHYDLCTPAEFRDALRRTGFSVEREYASYFSSVYFAGLLPIYVLSFAIDSLRHLTQAPAFSSHLVFVAINKSEDVS